MTATKILACLALGAALAGCGTLQKLRYSDEANPAPCPNVYALSEASRFIDFGEEEPSLDAVAWSGEILEVRTSCRYVADLPIEAEVTVDLAIGRGPAAKVREREVQYFVAVTRVNRDLIAKEIFTVPVRFKNDERALRMTEEVGTITIPRASEGTSGTNFAIAVGFVLTPSQVIYNRSGQSLKFPES